LCPACPGNHYWVKIAQGKNKILWEDKLT